MKSTEVKRGRPAWEDVAQSNNLGEGGGERREWEWEGPA